MVRIVEEAPASEETTVATTVTNESEEVEAPATEEDLPPTANQGRVIVRKQAPN